MTFKNTIGPFDSVCLVKIDDQAKFIGTYLDEVISVGQSAAVRLTNRCTTHELSGSLFILRTMMLLSDKVAQFRQR